MWETQVQPLGREDLLEKGMVTHSSILDNPLTKKKKKKPAHEDLKDILELKPKKDVLFIIWDWNTKVGSQEIRITGKFGLGVQNKAG